MTEQNVHKKRDVSSGERWPRLTKEEIKARPIRKYRGPIHLIRESEEIGPAVRQLEKETVPGIRHGDPAHVPSGAELSAGRPATGR